MKMKFEKFKMEEKTKNYLQEYSASTSLHGIRYLGESKTHPLEKLFWTAVIVTFVVLCGNEVAKVWIRWRSSPVIVSFAQRPTNVANIPFPAVTICPETRVRRSVVDVTKNQALIVKQLQGLAPYTSTTQQQLIEAMTLQCLDKKSEPDYLFPANFTPTPRHIDLLVNEITPQFEDIFENCRLGGLEKNCTEILRPSMTGYGVCYTFNILEESEFYTSNMKIGALFSKPAESVKKSTWDPEYGYRTRPKDETNFPYRSEIFVNRFFGVTFNLIAPSAKDLQNTCSNSNEESDFRVTIQSPVEYPDMFFGNIFRAAAGTETSVSIKPNLVTTSSTLRKTDPSIRQCYFAGEKNLTMFSIYTKSNCMAECENSLFMSYCSTPCINYIYPLNAKKPNLNYCSTELLNNSMSGDCGQTYEDKYNFHFGEERYSSLEKTGEAISCGCLPSCTELQYEFTMSTLPLQRFGNGTRNPRAVLSIFYDTEAFFARQRSELYGITDFVANCGGLLSLFSGFSLVTLVEAVYFATLRLACRIRNKRRAEQLEAITVLN